MPTELPSEPGPARHPSKVIAVLVPAVPWRDTRGFTPICVNSRQSLHITAQEPLFLSVMACHSIERTQANPLYLSENLTPQHAC